MKRVYAEARRKKMRRAIAGCTAAAAVFGGGFFFCVSNPTLAAQLPLIGNIFRDMQDNFGYQGDYSNVGTPLEDPDVAAQLETAENPEEMEQISQYTKTADGLTVTLSEIYCNDQALYITMQMKAEEALPDALSIQCMTRENYSFNPTEQADSPVLEGEKIDDNTFAGLLRFDLNQKTQDVSEYQAAREEALAAGEEWEDDAQLWEYVKTVEVPDQFTVELDISRIIGDLAETENESQNVLFDGPWSFTLEVEKDTASTQTVMIQDVNELGIGLEKVVKDKFEITMYEIYTEPEAQDVYMPVMLDADGRLMDYGSGGLVNTVAIGERDVSKVDVFLVDEDKWMNELKGAKWKEPGAMTEDGRTYKELLMEECAYQKEVVFE